MKRLILIALLLSGVAAYGQEGQPSWRKTFSLEIGVAPGPLHMQSHFISPSWEEEKALAELGQAASSNNAFHPSVSLSGVWRTGYRWETVATAGVSWSICRITQYDSFGIDPEGKPRYDLTKGTPAGWKALSPVASVGAAGRHIFFTMKRDGSVAAVTVMSTVAVLVTPSSA